MYFSCPLLYGSKATIQLYSFFFYKTSPKNQVKQNQIYTITLYGDDDNIGIVLLYWIWERTYGTILCFGFMIYVYSIHIKLRNDLHCPVSSLPKKDQLEIRSDSKKQRFIYIYSSHFLFIFFFKMPRKMFFILCTCTLINQRGKSKSIIQKKICTRRQKNLLNV